MDYYTIFEKEADDRNAVLMGIHKKIPSYALWRDIDIENESIEQRIKWWRNYIDAKSILHRNIALFWINKLFKN